MLEDEEPPLPPHAVLVSPPKWGRVHSVGGRVKIKNKIKTTQVKDKKPTNFY